MNIERSKNPKDVIVNVVKQNHTLKENLQKIKKKILPLKIEQKTVVKPYK